MNQIDILNSIKDVPVLCIGDIMLDSFIEGHVERISPEAPVPILRVDKEEQMLGGVGNVYSNLKALGCDTHLVSVVGNDQTGFDIAKFFKKDDNITLIYENDRVSTKKTRFRSGNQQLLRVDEEITTPINTTTISNVLNAVRMIMQKTKVVIISDYNKGLLANCCQDIINLAHKYQNIVLIDPKGKDYHKYLNADIITPNMNELTEISKIKLGNTHSIETAAKELIKNYKFKTVVVKRSEKGILVVNNRTTEIKGKKREVFDVSGAGDTVISTLAAILACGHSIETAAELANIAGGIVVTKQNTATVSVNEIIHELKDVEHSKIINKNDIEMFVKSLKEKSIKIGFSNGVFDIIHEGHIESLKQAKSFCDFLIIGVNNDASVKRLKGELRPILNENTRATILSALEYVNSIIIFDEDTPLNLIKSIKPDVLVKGSDYNIENIVGGDFVQSYGGEVKFITLKDGFSTTNIIKKIQDQKN